MSKNTKQNPLLFLFRKNWLYSEGNRDKVKLIWVMYIIAQSVNIFVTPFASAKIIQVVTEYGITPESVKSIIFYLCIFMIRPMTFWAIHGNARVIECCNAFKVRMNYRKYLLRGVITLPLNWHLDHHSGDTIDKIEKGTTGLYNFSENSYEHIYYLVQFLGSYWILVYMSPPSGFIVITMLLLSAWITVKIDKVLIPQYKELNRAENRISESVVDVISNVNTVIILRVERLVLKALEKKMEAPYELFKKNSKLNEIKWFLTSMCCNSMIVAVLLVYMYQNMGAKGPVVVSTLYLLLNFLGEMSQLFFRFAGSYGEIIKRSSRVSNSEELTAKFQTENYANHVLPNDWKKLEIRKLSFSYPVDGDKIHLDQIDVDLNRGEKIALIGESGSGKTTLLKIIRNLHDPSELELRVDGRQVTQGFEGIARAISLIPQDPEMFSGTIDYNLGVGAEYSEGDIRHFCKMACIDDTIQALPKKLLSLINEKGVNLSGGQKQRLALARGLLASSDKDIVLLDEPTSSLDTATEISVYKNIFGDFKGKTIVSSVHRLHLLPLFDKIYFFADGKIIESGDFGHLLQNSAEFQLLWSEYTKHHRNDLSVATSI